jgi:hypothetical protein
VDLVGGSLLCRLLLLMVRERQQMIISSTLLGIAENLAGTHDPAEFKSGIQIFLCATRMELDYAFVEFPVSSRGLPPSFDSVVTLPIRHCTFQMIARAAGVPSESDAKQQTTAGGETLGFDCTFDIPVEVAAAVCKYRHD